MNAAHYIPCDICGTESPRFILNSQGLDGPLVKCRTCGLCYVGARNSELAFGKQTAEETAVRLAAANQNLNFRSLCLEEERRLAQLNAQWRMDRIRRIKGSGKLLEIGCARGDFLRLARDWFDTSGVEPNPELADSSSQVAPVYRDVIERTPWHGFDVIASFHVIEHVDSPRSFISAAAERLKPGGLLVIETPNIDSLPFKLLKSRWRQFIPEHYFFFSPKTIFRLASEHGFQVDSVETIGKYASMDLIVNRLGRYIPGLRKLNASSSLTFRVNPMDIMILFATKVREQSAPEIR
jgi:2-polyprenyl-3-methyl-5-hydroxy-6-metoxy-1,4-benzoquinol methylase